MELDNNVKVNSVSECIEYLGFMKSYTMEPITDIEISFDETEFDSSSESYVDKIIRSSKGLMRGN